MENPFSDNNLDWLFESYQGQDGSTLAQRRESNKVEYKKSFSLAGLAGYAKEMVAFANKNGGYIVFGIEDSPHKLVGLEGSNKQQFEQFEPTRVSNFFKNHFSHMIDFENYMHESNGKYFGVFYIYSNPHKPIICKNTVTKNGDTHFSEGDIIYRYDSKSKPIEYQELKELIDYRVQRERRKWQRMMEKLGSADSLSQLRILDLEENEIGTQNIIVDEDLVEELNFIKEGEFTQTEGEPTLKLVGEIEGIEKSHAKPMDIDLVDYFQEFISGECQFPNQYVKHLKYFYKYTPIWFLVDQVGSKNDVLEILENDSGGRSGTLDNLIDRLTNPRSCKSYIKVGAIRFKNKIFDYLDRLEEQDDLQDYLEEVSDIAENEDINLSTYRKTIKRVITLWLLKNNIDVVVEKNNWTEDELKLLCEAISNIDSEYLEENELNIFQALDLIKSKYNNNEGIQGFIRKAFANIDLEKYCGE